MKCFPFYTHLFCRGRREGDHSRILLWLIYFKVLLFPVAISKTKTAFCFIARELHFAFAAQQRLK
jgi:hypothetical protein